MAPLCLLEHGDSSRMATGAEPCRTAGLRAPTTLNKYAHTPRGQQHFFGTTIPYCPPARAQTIPKHHIHTRRARGTPCSKRSHARHRLQIHACKAMPCQAVQCNAMGLKDHDVTHGRTYRYATKDTGLVVPFGAGTDNQFMLTRGHCWGAPPVPSRVGSQLPLLSNLC